MASIFKPTRIKNGKRVKRKHWYIAYRDENGRRVVAPGYISKELTEAKAKELEKAVDMRRAGVHPRQAKSYEEAKDAYLTEMELLGRDNEYIREQKRQLSLLSLEFDWQTVDDITADQLRKHQAALLAKGRAPRTLNTVRDALSIFCNFCRERGWLESNPITVVKKAKAPGGQKRRRRRAYTAEQLNALVSAAPKWRLPYLLAALSGLRRSEIMHLQKCDLTPVGEYPTWHLRPEIAKGRRLDRVPMLPECAELIRPLWEALPAANSPLKIRCPASREMHGHLRKAKLDRFDDLGHQLDFHALRYTFCSMLGRVLPIQTVRLLMRHRDIRTTANLYLVLGIADVAEQLPLLPRLLDSTQR